MFISVLELFKIGIGPSSSHTIGPMTAARDFMARVAKLPPQGESHIRCTLKGSLAFTGKGHGTDAAILLGLHGYEAGALSGLDMQQLTGQFQSRHRLTSIEKPAIFFSRDDDIIFDLGETLPEHPNGMIFELVGQDETVLLSQTYFSIGGGSISTFEEINRLVAPLKMESDSCCPYPFDSAASMLAMAEQSKLSIAEMKRFNELAFSSEQSLDKEMERIWQSMKSAITNGLQSDGILPGGLKLKRRAKNLYAQFQADPEQTTVNDWLCAYAMAISEENAAGHMVVTAPTNGAAGVIPAVLYYFVLHENGSEQQVYEFLLTAGAIGGLIKHRSSISGAEVGCQGEIGTAAAMAAAGLCAVRGGSAEKIENAAEIALEHHLGLTCDPVKGLVQVPCIERNAFGAIKAYAAASLALHGTGQHFMPLDNCIAAMKQTGLEMSVKYKETSLGGLAVSITEC